VEQVALVETVARAEQVEQAALVDSEETAAVAVVAAEDILLLVKV
jgi:hypothetical protein